MRSLHDTLGKLGYICVNTPILTSNDCEGAGEVFNVVPHSKDLVKSMKRGKVSDGESFFGCEAFLSVSGQLQLEAAAR
jgi:asparaginyl-tRNA synthetase